MAAAGIPGPVSQTSSRIHPCARGCLDVHPHLAPGWGDLEGIVEQIEENLPGAERVEQERREIRGTGQLEGQPIFGCLGRSTSNTVAHSCAGSISSN
jgi:hypothetical protein